MAKRPPARLPEHRQNGLGLLALLLLLLSLLILALIIFAVVEYAFSGNPGTGAAAESTTAAVAQSAADNCHLELAGHGTKEYVCRNIPSVCPTDKVPMYPHGVVKLTHVDYFTIKNGQILDCHISAVADTPIQSIIDFYNGYLNAAKGWYMEPVVDYRKNGGKVLHKEDGSNPAAKLMGSVKLTILNNGKTEIGIATRHDNHGVPRDQSDYHD